MSNTQITKKQCFNYNKAIILHSIKRKIMKKTVLLFLSLLFTVVAKSQLVSIVSTADAGKGDSIDVVKFEVVYDLDATVPAKEDTTKYSERMLLQIGSKASAFYSYVAYQVDSLVAEQVKQGGDIQIKNSSKVSWKLYKNVPEVGQTAFLDRVCNDNYRVVEKMENPEWKFVPDSVKEILGYHCRFAEADFKGRHWLAWYAEEVPIDNGPWKLQGLPGLILKAYDSNREFVFTAVGLTNADGKSNIGYKGKNYSEVSRKDLNKIYKRYYADPIGYLFMTFPQSSTNKLTVKDENGNDRHHSKPVAYNLIEW